jgi:UDP-glucuronate decarboxylase
MFAYKTNVMGTLNMLGLAKRVGARFLLTSTSEVYGDPLEHPQKETYWGNVNPIGQMLVGNICLFVSLTQQCSVLVVDWLCFEIV